ncbi:MAG: GntR family transcriptional regulator [Rhodobacteraceae bacterium]|nr:GntR family transcriptional regulator [Paracoccaceae bacterium]
MFISFSLFFAKVRSHDAVRPQDICCPVVELTESLKTCYSVISEWRVCYKSQTIFAVAVPSGTLNFRYVRRYQTNRQSSDKMPEKAPMSTSNSFSEQVYKSLRDALISGDIEPGEKISIRTVAAKHQISAMPVRDALKRLEAQGALEVEAKRAYRVPILSPKNAAELFQVRSVLEAAGAAAAAQSITNAELERLEQLCDANDIAWRKNDVGTFLHTNAKFHHIIHNRSGNSFLAETLATINMRSGPWLGLAIRKIVDQVEWGDKHRRILEALRNRDSDEASRLMEEDSNWGMQLFQSVDTSKETLVASS